MIHPFTTRDDIPKTVLCKYSSVKFVCMRQMGQCSFQSALFNLFSSIYALVTGGHDSCIDHANAAAGFVETLNISRAFVQVPRCAARAKSRPLYALGTISSFVLKPLSRPDPAAWFLLQGEAQYPYRPRSERTLHHRGYVVNKVAPWYQIRKQTRGENI